MLKHRQLEAKKPQRVVVLGSSGFVGKALLSYFHEQGMNAIGLGSKDLDLSADDAPKKLNQTLQATDCLIILSALTPDKGRGIDTLMKNLRMIENVAAALKELPVEYVMYCSSDAVYSMDFPVINEQTPAVPVDLYGVMHRTREIMLQTVSPSNLCIIRPTLIYGAEDSHNSYGPNRFRRQARTDQKISLGGEGEETRDHVYIDDVVKLIALLTVHQSTGVLNIATGQSHSFMTVAKQVASLFSSPIDIVTSSRQAPITYRQFDIACIRDAFPDFRFTPLEDGTKIAHEG